MTHMTETAAPKKKLTGFQKAVIALLAVLIVLVVIVGIVTTNTIRGAEMDRQRAECDQYGSGSLDYFYCMGQVGK